MRAVEPGWFRYHLWIYVFQGSLAFVLPVYAIYRIFIFSGDRRVFQGQMTPANLNCLMVLAHFLCAEEFTAKKFSRAKDRCRLICLGRQ